MSIYLKNVAFVLIVASAVLVSGCTDNHPFSPDSPEGGHELEGQYTDVVHDEAVRVVGRTIQNITQDLLIGEEPNQEERTFVGRIVNLQFGDITEDGVETTGRLIGTLNGQRVNETFEAVLPFVDELGNAIDPGDVLSGNGVTQILFLELGPVFLDLLGLIVEIPDPIIVEIRAEEGPGQLLGNLLVGLLSALD